MLAGSSWEVWRKIRVCCSLSYTAGPQGPAPLPSSPPANHPPPHLQVSATVAWFWKVRALCFYSSFNSALLSSVPTTEVLAAAVDVLSGCRLMPKSILMGNPLGSSLNFSFCSVSPRWGFLRPRCALTCQPFLGSILKEAWTSYTQLATLELSNSGRGVGKEIVLKFVPLAIWALRAGNCWL